MQLAVNTSCRMPMRADSGEGGEWIYCEGSSSCDLSLRDRVVGRSGAVRPASACPRIRTSFWGGRSDCTCSSDHSPCRSSWDPCDTRTFGDPVKVAAKRHCTTDGGQHESATGGRGGSEMRVFACGHICC